MIANYDNGGLRAPSIDVMAKSLKLAWISRLLSQEENSKEISKDSWKAIPIYLSYISKDPFSPVLQRLNPLAFPGT